MLSEKTILGIRVWRTVALKRKCVVNQLKIPSERQEWFKSNPLSSEYRDELISYYYNGTGFKIIAKELGLSYTQTRRLFIDWLGVETRKGTSIITDALRKRRSENAKGEKSNFFDWVSKRPEQAKKQTKSIQGLYKRKDGELVWLRSCLEYIYAKWLDSNNIEWKAEVEVFRGDGETYRPDFFIYSNGELQKIVEIKGNFFDNRDSRSEKAKRVAEKNRVKLEIVFDITPYLEQNTYYHKELKAWKNSIRLFGEK
jgi:hypothetical protein